MRVFQNPPRPPSCFFCLETLSHSPRNPESFKCPFCLCWNRYDKDGQIVSDEPAMRDESLNAASFAKRASPSKHRLPTVYHKGPFCHTCETNQMLLMNMLSNYLPAPEDPSYETRVAEMPAYTTSLQARYPPVCKNCQPAVDEELRKKEHMARTTALGGWLKQSQRMGTQRPAETQRGKRDVFMWKVRAILWIQTVVLFIVVDVFGFLEYNLTRQWPCLLLLPFSLLSLLWTFWDPTWLVARQALLHGRAFRVSGREKYIRCQAIAWLSRLMTSSLMALRRTEMFPHYMSTTHFQTWYAIAFAIETVLSLFSLFTLRTRQPPAVRLLESKILKPEISPIPTPNSKPPISNLPLSNQHFANATGPIFGQPSFPQSTIIQDVSADDMMDWTPVNPTPERVQDREDWMRPQRFFPPEQPTGLEDLFEKAKLDVEEHAEQENRWAQEQHEKRGDEIPELGLFLAATLMIALIAGLAAYRFQDSGRNGNVTHVTMK